MGFAQHNAFHKFGVCLIPLDSARCLNAPTAIPLRFSRLAKHDEVFFFSSLSGVFIVDVDYIVSADFLGIELLMVLQMIS